MKSGSLRAMAWTCSSELFSRNKRPRASPAGKDLVIRQPRMPISAVFSPNNTAFRKRAPRSGSSPNKPRKASERWVRRREMRNRTVARKPRFPVAVTRQHAAGAGDVGDRIIRQAQAFRCRVQHQRDPDGRQQLARITNGDEACRDANGHCGGNTIRAWRLPDLSQDDHISACKKPCSRRYATIWRAFSSGVAP